ncbi:energy transducer TonB [Novosphingobium umbonatum]|uniref:Energy transducer TonB n=1 Tax=Novosphingobium umbonatum TaxID=1908524 RepID=A0A3S2URX2_9SPHN|nr:energy transducer TonB [Novosphingobium umbonatum]RVU04704.1 energy transducer TonB [Novosphingobium umbonatum]
MAYADQQMSGNRITAIVIVALIHAGVGYALVTGLAYEAATKIMKKVTTVDIKDEVKPPPPPPPPPKDDVPPPPVVAPPPPVNVAPVTAPTIETVAVAPPVAPPAPVLAPPAAPAPPAPRFQPVGAAPKGNPANWVTPEDYPSRPLREGVQGTTGFKLTVGPDGRVTGCEITLSSGNSELDAATCKYASSRARFAPAKDGEGQPTTGVYSNRVKWVIPKD